MTRFPASSVHLLERRRVIAACAVLLSFAIGPASRAGDGSIADPSGDLRFEVNFRFPPTPQQLTDTKAALAHMSEMLCDATDGEVRVSQIRLTAGAVDEDKAGFWYQSQPGRSGGSFYLSGAGLRILGNHLNIFAGAHFQSDVLAHEMGHHAFGLGEQYDEQRRFGGPCGIGPGFEAGTVDEQNHSIMQQSGRTQCLVGGNRCLRDADCPGSTCEAVLMSEMSVAMNHDALRGDLMLCPAAQPVTQIALAGALSPAAAVQVFDATAFATADATSAARRDVEAIDDIGALPANTVVFFLTHTGPQTWQVSAAIDDGEVGGTSGDLELLEQWTLTFSAADGSLTAISENPPALAVAGLTTGAGDLAIQLDFGSPTSGGGTGLDGLRELGGATSVTASRDGFPGCTADDCAARWNAMTNRWESSHQSLIHGFDSDWETLVDNYPFLTAPAGLPVQAPPAACFAAPAFVEDIVGSDQAMLIIDRSWSMTWSSRDDVSEVCDNGRDDDADGDVDEGECAQARLDFIQAAARAFIDLQDDQGIQLGILEFDDGNRLVRPIEDLTTLNAQSFKDDVDDIVPGNNTAIGSALAAAEPEFVRVEAAGRTRAAILMSDGENNRGVDPATAADDLRDIGVRVHTIPAGSAADVDLLSDISGETGGVMIAASPPDELPAVYAEMSARYGGEALALPRTPFSVQRKREQTPDLQDAAGIAAETGGTSGVPELRAFTIPVEAGADRLTTFISGRNGRMSTWALDFELRGPGGEIIGPASPEVRQDPYYVFARVASPTPGDWQLRVRPGGPGLQESILVAQVENADPDFVVDVEPRVAAVASPVLIAAQPSFVTDLEGGTSIRGVVRRPDGSSVPVTLVQDPLTRSWSLPFSGYAGRGLYEVELHLTVSDEARPAAGEPIFDGPEQPPISVTPFERRATAAFYLADGPFPPCGTDDCDGDGIPNGEEPFADADGDGTPNYLDTDSDNDEVPDRFEGTPDAYVPQSEPPSTGPSGFGRPYRYSFHVGSTHPLGSIDRAADANVYLRVDGSRALTNRLRLLGMAGLAQLTAETAPTSPHRRWIHASANLQALLAPRPSGLRPFVQLGPGLYWPKGGGSDGGLNLGVGAQIPLAAPFGLELGIDYHRIDDDGDTKLVTWQIGLLFR